MGSCWRECLSCCVWGPNDQGLHGQVGKTILQMHLTGVMHLNTILQPDVRRPQPPRLWEAAKALPDCALVVHFSCLGYIVAFVPKTVGNECNGDGCSLMCAGMCASAQHNIRCRNVCKCTAQPDSDAIVPRVHVTDCFSNRDGIACLVVQRYGENSRQRLDTHVETT